MKVATLFLAMLSVAVGCTPHASSNDQPNAVQTECNQELHADVLALGADRGLDNDTRKAKNWFRHYDSATGIWRQASATDSHTPWKEMEATVDDYMRRTHRGDYKLISRLHHAYLRVLVYQPPPVPEGFSRMDGPDVVLWYDTRSKQIVAETY